jgi:tRNA G46 methylase TrmB
MFQPPREINSKQQSPHEDLLKLVERHRNNHFQRPIADHTRVAFERAMMWLLSWRGDVIIDACCGVGESTLHLAKQFPDAKIIGIDKSSVRLQKHQHYATQQSMRRAEQEGPVSSEGPFVNDEQSNNYLILQADLNDFWRLLAATLKQQAQPWQVVKQYILYPNPYPKKPQVGKRWHASAVFPAIVASCKVIELRSNWKVYVEEFAIAAKYYGIDMQVSELHINATQAAITPFERKYSDGGQALWTAITLGTGCDK